MLAIFDIDGTICDTQKVEGVCFARAIEYVTGRSLATLDGAAYNEPTSSAISRDLLADDLATARKKAEIEREFVRLLELERSKFPGDFLPLAGASEFIQQLQTQGICQVAIATGAFASEARFKLQCCGIALDAIPHATSSDTPRRREIIALAASRAGFDLSAVVYFGDAPWDAHVSSLLDIPMIGIGRRHERLRGLGIEHVFRDYTEPDSTIDVLLGIKKRMTNKPNAAIPAKRQAH